MEIEDLKGEIRRAARGDRDSAALLFDAYYPRVYRYALAKLGRRADAEDVAAETFARVLAHIDRFTWRGGGFEAWLFRIASNLVVDRIRASQRERVEDTDPEHWTQAFEHVEQDVLERAAGREIASLLRGLPDEQREVLLLRFAAGLDTHETGKVMKRKPNAIRQLQFRALTGLRERLQTEVQER